MKNTVRNGMMIVVAFVLGSAVNMGLIMLGSKVIPPPAGVNVADMESLKNSMHLLQPIHFIFPFLAHALGTLAGAFLAALLAASHQMAMAMGIGVLFILGGVTNTFMLPAPAWFIAIDLIAAYLPMAWLGGKLAGRLKSV